MIRPLKSHSISKGMDHYVLTGGGGGGFGNFFNKLFAEAVDTQINSTQVKKMFAERRRHTKKLFAAGAAYEKNFCM